MNIYGEISWFVLFLISVTFLIFRKRLKANLQIRSNVIFNEQIKLTATALNNIAIALIVGGLLLPIFQGHSEISNTWTKNGALSVWALVFGFTLHAMALFVLGKMKG